MKELHARLTNPEVFPVELTLSSGDEVKLEHPDFVHCSVKLGKIFVYESGGGIFEMILPSQIVKVRAKTKRKRAA